MRMGHQVIGHCGQHEVLPPLCAPSVGKLLHDFLNCYNVPLGEAIFLGGTTRRCGVSTPTEYITPTLTVNVKDAIVF